MTGLRIDGLGISHDGTPIVRDISITVREGESLCLIGASGSGKSLIAAAIAGLLPDCMLATGRISLGNSTAAAADQPALRALWQRQTCLLPQEPGMALAPLLTALAQVRLPPPRLDAPAGRAWLARFGLDRHAAGRYPFELSGGMAQRLLAALAMRAPARVLVVDEPTKGLDTTRRDEVLHMLSLLRDEGRAVLAITHDLAVPRALGGQVAVLEGGRIVESGDASQVLSAPRSAFARACLAADPRHWTPPPTRSTGLQVAGTDALVIARRHKLAGPLDLDIREGSMTAIFGPSGVGKTTLGDTMLGLCPPAAGRVTWLGRLLDRRRRATLRQHFQKLHQDPHAVFPAERRLGDSLSDLARIAPGAGQALPPLLDRLGIAPALLARRPAEISGGEAQRIALARVLALRPVLMVADEPCSRLDPPTQAATLRLLRDLADGSGLAVILITHDRTVAANLADTTVTLTPEDK